MTSEGRFALVAGIGTVLAVVVPTDNDPMARQQKVLNGGLAVSERPAARLRGGKSPIGR